MPHQLALMPTRLCKILNIGRDDEGIKLDEKIQHGKTNLKNLQVIIRHEGESGHERSVFAVRRRVAGAGHGRQRSAPEVVLGEQDLSLVRRDALHLVRPLPSQLARRLARLDAYGRRSLNDALGSMSLLVILFKDICLLSLSLLLPPPPSLSYSL